MPRTSSGESVYADPDELVSYVQTDPQTLGVSATADEDSDGASDWQEYLEALQTKAKGRIDDYCRRDFEDHPDETVTLDGGDEVLFLPGPVRDVRAVRVGGRTLSDDEWTVKESGALGIRGGSPEGWGNVEVELDHGYARAPPAVAEAEMKLVDHTVVGQAQKREGMVVESDSFSVEVNIPVAWNREVAGMLKPHRRMGVFS